MEKSHKIESVIFPVVLRAIKDVQPVHIVIAVKGKLDLLAVANNLWNGSTEEQRTETQKLLSEIVKEIEEKSGATIDEVIEYASKEENFDRFFNVYLKEQRPDLYNQIRFTKGAKEYLKEQLVNILKYLKQKAEEAKFINEDKL